MTGTPTPTCQLCGLRFASRPLLELHIREDHRGERRDGPGRDRDGTRATPASARPARSRGLAAKPSRTTKEAAATAAARRPRRGPALTVPRRAIRALRHVNDELLAASEAIIGSARAPRARPQASEQGRISPISKVTSTGVVP